MARIRYSFFLMSQNNNQKFVQKMATIEDIIDQSMKEMYKRLFDECILGGSKELTLSESDNVHIKEAMKNLKEFKVHIDRYILSRLGLPIKIEQQPQQKNIIKDRQNIAQKSSCQASSELNKELNVFSFASQSNNKPLLTDKPPTKVDTSQIPSLFAKPVANLFDNIPKAPFLNSSKTVDIEIKKTSEGPIILQPQKDQQNQRNLFLNPFQNPFLNTSGLNPVKLDLFSGGYSPKNLIKSQTQSNQRDISVGGSLNNTILSAKSEPVALTHSNELFQQPKIISQGLFTGYPQSNHPIKTDLVAPIKPSATANLFSKPANGQNNAIPVNQTPPKSTDLSKTILKHGKISDEKQPIQPPVNNFSNPFSSAITVVKQPIVQKISTDSVLTVKEQPKKTQLQGFGDPSSSVQQIKELPKNAMIKKPFVPEQSAKQIFGVSDQHESSVSSGSAISDTEEDISNITLSTIADVLPAASLNTTLLTTDQDRQKFHAQKISEQLIKRLDVAHIAEFRQTSQQYYPSNYFHVGPRYSMITFLRDFSLCVKKIIDNKNPEVIPTDEMFVKIGKEVIKFMSQQTPTIQQVSTMYFSSNYFHVGPRRAMFQIVQYLIGFVEKLYNHKKAGGGVF